MEDHLKSDQEILISVKKILEHGYFCCSPADWVMEGLQSVVRVRMDQMEIINPDIFILYLNIKIEKFM